MSADVHAQLAAVMEALVRAAVAELRKQQCGDLILPGEEPPGPAGDNLVVCFATVLETLANEALEKILDIVEPRRPDGGVPDEARVESEHSYGVPAPGRPGRPLARDEAPEETSSIPAAEDRRADDVAESENLTVGAQSARRRPSVFFPAGENGNSVGRRGAAPVSSGESSDKPFACELCGRRFTLRHNLRRHARGHAAGGKPFRCGECGKGFTRALTLRTHRLIHTGQKHLECERCSKSFRHSVNLKNHLRVHSGERPFACEVCGKTFGQAANLKIHGRVHTGERPYACRQCGKTFSQRSGLTAHGRTHSGRRDFVCESCLKRFNNANSLKLHRRVHTGERPYACDVCRKTFSQGSHLRTHKSHLHAGGKRFICDKCGKRYADARNLKAHKCGYA
ncbi:zinc finger protein 32-like isoform X1 [Corythoichthys intestinalis]|uniref:zinc finger protein 32-like isoform X1 n=1 Tax=Corythoichthys intestinalis TaxID=161448 RepID=UPI0025A62BCA|nr:zinc finger protein 32-like isoform X1 [Corythoichthys intestinalis]